MSRVLLEAYFAALNARDWGALAALLAPGVRDEVPQTGEVVRTPAHVTAFNRRFPGEWSIEVDRALADDALGMAEIVFRDGEETQRAVVIHEYRDGLISRITDYWPDPHDPPAFRAGWPEIERVREAPAVPLPTRPLGAAPPTVTRLGLGLAALGRPGYLNLGHGADVGADKDVDALRRRAWEILDAAWAAGVRYFDAARSYGEAEAFLGGWLRGRGHGAAVDRAAVGSKWGYTYTAGWRTDAEQHEVKDHSPATLGRQWPETLAALGRPDVYLIHSATLETGVLEDERVLARLAELAAEGVRVGLSTSGPAQADTLRRALAVRVDGVNPLSVVQATWNVLEPSVEEALTEAHAAGWGVVVKEGVANGRLTARGTVPPALAEVCGELNATPDAVALAAVLARPWADVVLSGATTAEQLRDNLGALSLTLTPAHLDALRGLAQTPADYWRERSALPWT